MSEPIQVKAITYDERLIISFSDSKTQFITYDDFDVVYHFERERHISLNQLLDYYIEHKIRPKLNDFS